MKVGTGINLNTYIEIEESAVKLRAYYEWENAGKPEGRSDEFYYKALNDIFDETKEKVIQASADEENGYLELAAAFGETDSSWYLEIEEVMPEIKNMIFKNVSHKVSWMFNNLKKLKEKDIQPTGAVIKRPVELNKEESIQIVIEPETAPVPFVDPVIPASVPLVEPTPVIEPVVQPEPVPVGVPVGVVGDNPGVQPFAIIEGKNLEERARELDDFLTSDIPQSVIDKRGGPLGEVLVTDTPHMDNPDGVERDNPILQKQVLPSARLDTDRFKEMYREDKLVFQGQVA